MHFVENIREFGESKVLLQVQLAVSLEIDATMFSKIEREERKAKKEQVEQLAQLLVADRKPLLKLWLAEQLIELVNSNEFAIDSVQLATK